MRHDALRRALACLAIILAACASATAWAAEAPTDREDAGPVVRRQADGTLLVADVGNGYRLTLPGAYWNPRTTAQLTGETGSGSGGCTPAGGGTPPGLLLLIQNEDAPAVMTLELPGARFLMRNQDDLENYVDELRGRLMKRGGAGIELTSSSYDERDGMIAARATFSANMGGEEQR